MMVMVMVVVAAMMVVPAMPTMMVVVPPMHFRRRQSGILLNRRGGARIAERQRIGALGRRDERKHRANGGEPKNFRDKNFRELHECSPWVGCHVCAESLAATLHAIWRPRLEWVLNECATEMNGCRLRLTAILAHAIVAEGSRKCQRGAARRAESDLRPMKVSDKKMWREEPSPAATSSSCAG
ncbi:hypothetical protein IVB30_00870 [Bradyrhizobium sp. 200]|uniref:hypothetical protein n=1 Tax=Bradyrhizobium sp. 200 TaxID=2782665 RepID=UPI00206CB4AF|nr:hypothetical protein IVB30_00870 [Bradyrhizobium sp. 200]